MKIKFNKSHRILVAGLCAALISACASNSPSKFISDVFESEDTGVPTYSELTRKETEETLKRLQAIRNKLAEQRSDAYQGPIRHVWDRILARPQIQYEDNLRIEKQATVLLRDNKYLYRVSLRAEPYIYYILDEIDKRNLPRELALLPVIESAYRPTAISRSKAAGLWQFIPSTSKFLGMKTNWWYDARRDVITSTKYALDYLETINQKFDGDWLLTLAAYNAGHGKVSRAITYNKKRGKPTDYWNLKLPRETMNYVPRFLAASRIYTRPEDYGVSLYPVKNKPHIAITNIESQIDLQLAAEMANLSLKELKIYNPGFLRWATAPSGPHRLVLPINKLNGFNQKLALLDDNKRLRWVEHKVKKGDTLTGIALKNGVSVSMLKSTNKLKGSLIRTGQTLVVPQKGGAVNTQMASTDHSIQPTKSHEFYIVKSGDTLWHIARRYKMTTNALLALNKLHKDSVIKPGQRIKVRARKTAKVALNLNS